MPDPVKQCQGCGIDFSVPLSRGSNRRAFCDTCFARADHKKRMDKNKNLKNTYGITLHQFLTLLRLQNHKCLGCENTLKETSTRPVKGGKRVPDESVVDHNHETGEVRGILCHNCNVAVGHMQDDWKIADRLSEYLKD